MCPEPPGFGFSGKPAGPGWDLSRWETAADNIVSMRLGKGRRRGLSIALACSKIGYDADRRPVSAEPLSGQQRAFNQVEVQRMGDKAAATPGGAEPALRPQWNGHGR